MNNVHGDNYLQIRKKGHGRNRIGYPSVGLIISKISACKKYFSEIIIPKNIYILTMCILKHTIVERLEEVDMVCCLQDYCYSYLCKFCILKNNNNTNSVFKLFKLHIYI